MNTKHNLAVFIAALALITGACNENNPVNDIDLIAVEHPQNAGYVLAVEQFINEAEFIARSFKTAYPNQPGVLMGSTITAGLTEEGKTKYDIVFNNTTGPDNKKRNGKLSVVIENGIENGQEITGKHLHVRSDDEHALFTVNGVKFKGSLIYTNIAPRAHAENNLVSHLNAQSFLYAPNGEEIRFSSTRKSTWKGGFNTTDIDDDKFEISEQSYSLSVTNSGTRFIEANTHKTLIVNYLCTERLFTPTEGVMKVEQVGGNTAYLMLGNGSCAGLPGVSLKP